MKLVKYENYKLEVADELFLLKPFRQLYNADKTKEKTKFFDFLTILYFVYDPRSEYSDIPDDKLRLEDVCESNGLKIPKFNDKELLCIELYKKLTVTPSGKLLKSAIIAADKVRVFLEGIDLYETDDKGKLINPVNAITKALVDIPKIVDILQESEEKVAKELEDAGRARGGNTKTLMDDGINLN